MTLETTALMDMVLATQHANDCVPNPDASPAGTPFRVFFDSPFLGQNAGTGVFENTSPQAYAKTSDVGSILPEVTVLLIDGTRYTTARKERVEGDARWSLLILREVRA